MPTRDPARPAAEKATASTPSPPTNGHHPVPERMLRSAFDDAPIGMAVTSTTGVVSHVNTALTQLLQRPAAALVGRTFFEITHPEDLPAARDSCARMGAGDTDVVRQECRFSLPDGSSRWVMVSTSRPAAVPGHAPCLIMHIEDISDRKALQSELLHRSLHDPLTGLPNRTLLLDRIGHALARTRSPSRVCLFYLDLDGFKTINDTHGHAVGDQVLQHVAARLTGLLRPGDTAGRLGGDEFAVLCEDIDLDQATGIAERLRAAIAVPLDLGPSTPTLCLSVAVGLSSSDSRRPGHDAHDAASLLTHADLHMYEAKRRRER